MDYADELLELAREIANLHRGHPRQASLRRAVSTAYYALFHLLISEAMGRAFDHGPMKQAAEKKVSELRNYFKQKPVEGQERTVAFHLHNVADTFVETQYFRNDADYNTVKE
jgi:hypothetical protein